VTFFSKTFISCHEAYSGRHSGCIAGVWRAGLGGSDTSSKMAANRDTTITGGTRSAYAMPVNLRFASLR
jgi:hypothetical protein